MNAVDLFAGAGGWSHGWREATGREPLLAVNHCEHAIHLHRLNHPGTEHFPKDVWEVLPQFALRGRRVDWLHGSPDCTHFSRAKGGKPREQKIRALAWVLVEWARAARPRILSLENVAEFTTWGPLDDVGQPIKERAGETFREFVRTLRALGYAVDWRVLCAADFGAPTIRRRLFLVARRDGEAIRWPEPTHGPGRAQPWRTAAECIDWSLPCPSIFGRKRPLAPATCRRIAAGILRFVLQGQPFLVTLTTGSRPRGVDEPTTVVTGQGGHHGLVTPFLAETGNGERVGQAPRVRSIDEPLLTVTGTGSQGALVAPLLHQYYGGADASRSKDVRAPLPTITADGNHSTLVAAFLQQNFTGIVGKPLRVPVPTITARDHHSLVAATLLANNTNNAPQRADAPLGTVTTGGRHGLVAAFLTQFYGTGIARRADQPLGAVLAKAAHQGLVTVAIDGVDYAIADIGLRMLEPRELARAQGFPDSYVLEGTKAQQIARIGNSVVPQVAAAIVRANLGQEVAVA